MAAPTIDNSTHGKSQQATTSSGRSIGTATSKRSGAAPIFDPADTGLREEMIRQAAYFRSQHRRDFPGNELDDWLAAEHEIDEMIARVRSRSGERWRTACSGPLSTGELAPNVKFAPMRSRVRKIPTDIRLRGAA